MPVLSLALALFVAVSHVGFMVLEMFVWNTPTGHRIFAQTPEQAAASQVLAANQGLYNGLLAAGLVWGALFAPEAARPQIVAFFLASVLVAGLYGGATAKPTIWLIQALPAAIALGVLWMQRGV